MKNISEIEKVLRIHKKILKDKFQIDKIGLFGSYVRGENNINSDIDILVEFEENADFGFIRFIEIENYLSELLGVKVDLVEKKALKPKIGKRILDEVIFA